MLVKDKFVNHEIVMHQTSMGIYEENVYRITKEGLREINKKLENFDGKVIDIIEQVKRSYNDMPLSMLIHEVYTKYLMKS
jgi:DNA-binding PadR family transcriptional regulator